MIAHVALPLPLNKTFSYAVPGRLESFAKPLVRVTVPFGSRTLIGFILSLEEGEKEGLKELADILDIFPLIDDKTFELCRWASHYYVTPIGVVLKYALPPKLNIVKYLLTKATDDRFRHLDGLPVKAASVQAGKRELWDYYRQGLVEFTDSYTGASFRPLPESVLRKEYRPALYVADVAQRKEKYLAVISECLDQGQNVLLLLPDYHVVGDYFYRLLVEALGKCVVWYTSSQPKARMEVFFRTRTETGSLVLGNKSALLLPILRRGMIIVERPEEDEYRNEEAFHFHAVRLALKTAELNRIPILFGSASPPLDLVRLAEEGAIALEKEQDLCLGRRVAEITTESRIREHIPAGLAEVIDSTLQSKETMAIYTPRKDYAFRLYCLECKKPFLCPDCEIPLAYQREQDRLVCSACKKSFPYDERCAHCGGSLIQFSSTGVEFVEERLSAAATEQRVLRITAESLKKKDVQSLLESSRAPGTLVIGTQMLSRIYGLRVRRLVLLGQEEFLWMAGYRAHERIYQTFRNLIDALLPEEVLLVVGRRGLIDTSHLIDQDRFYAEELAKRKLAEFPPYVRFFLVEVWKKGEQGERLVGRIVERVREEGFDSKMIGPMLTKKGGLHWRLVLKGDEDIFAELFSWLYGLTGVRIEPDPPTI